MNTDLSKERSLPAIDWNIEEQLNFLKLLRFSHEILDIPTTRKLLQPIPEFYFGNIAFESGDAEYWYNIIRFFKPKRIIEVGSGYSTLIARRAIIKNIEEDPSYSCEHMCIEPYENPWLNKIGVSLIRSRVEEVDLSFFYKLKEGDILFIDSSHIIRPYGDILYLYLEVLPSLHKGVIVHIHDIFSPRNYPRNWLVDEVRLWNEQYILEAFLSHNDTWKIIGALNFLHHHYYEELKKVAPFLTPDREPGSFYIQKVK